MESFGMALGKNLFSFSLVFCLSVMLFGFDASVAFSQEDPSGPQKVLLDTFYEGFDVDVVRVALQNGADPNWISNTKRKTSVLGSLSMASYVSILRDSGSEKNILEVLSVLTKAGAHLQWCDYDILYMPISSGSLKLTETFLKMGASPTRPIEGKTPIELAIEEGHGEIVELLVKYGAEKPSQKDALLSKLFGASSNHDYKLVRRLVGDGANVNVRNNRDETPLLVALRHAGCEPKGYLTVSELLKAGADPNEAGESYFTSLEGLPLHMAVFSTSVDIDGEIPRCDPVFSKYILQELLQAGAYVSGQDSNGRTPLHVAAEFDSLAGAKILLENGSKVMPKDKSGVTPLDLAESGEMIKLLKAYGAREL